VRTYWLDSEPAVSASRSLRGTAPRDTPTVCRSPSPVRAAPPRGDDTGPLAINVCGQGWESVLHQLGFGRESSNDAAAPGGADGTTTPSPQPVYLLSASPSIAAHLARIQVLALTACNLRAVEVLQLPVMPVLTAVDLSDNALTDIGTSDVADDAYWLAFAPKLTSLTLRGCGLTRVPPLVAAPALTTLDVSCNEITGVGALEAVSGTLIALNLAYNAFTSLASLRALSLLTRLTALSLHPNPVTLGDDGSGKRAVTLVRNLLPSLLEMDGRPLPRVRALSAGAAGRGGRGLAAIAPPPPGNTTTSRYARMSTPSAISAAAPFCVAAVVSATAASALTSVRALPPPPQPTTALLTSAPRRGRSATASTTPAAQAARARTLSRPMTRTDRDDAPLSHSKWVGNTVRSMHPRDAAAATTADTTTRRQLLPSPPRASRPATTSQPTALPPDAPAPTVPRMFSSWIVRSTPMAPPLLPRNDAPVPAVASTAGYPTTVAAVEDAVAESVPARRASLQVAPAALPPSLPVPPPPPPPSQPVAPPPQIPVPVPVEAPPAIAVAPPPAAATVEGVAQEAALAYAADWMRATNLRTLTLVAAIKRLMGGLADDAARLRWAASAATPVFLALESVGLAPGAGTSPPRLEVALACIASGTPPDAAAAAAAPLPMGVLRALCDDDAAAVLRCHAQLVSASHAVAALRSVAELDRAGHNALPALHALTTALAASPLHACF